MPPSVDQAKFLTLAETAKIIPGSVHINTIRRWSDPNRGYAGVILKTWRCGNRRVTTVDAIDEFMRATSECVDPNPRRSVSIAHQKAEAVLVAAGV